MMRVDYIRVPGNEWVPDPDDRFTTIDMRGPLITLIYRAVDAVYGDLPKKFKLGEQDLQAESVGIPAKVIREAITNALMHRSYEVNSPIQIIRYDNRIEIMNAGYSLKSEEQLGSPGSEARNPYIAEVFHETNLAETKGTGIRAMRKLLREAQMAPPTFESDRESNRFIARLLIHHLLSREDLVWLASLKVDGLNDEQKQALIFVREVGAIDNSTYRQFADVDTLRAGYDLRYLRDSGYLAQKGKKKGTYYVAGPTFGIGDASRITTEGKIATTEGIDGTTEGLVLNTDASEVDVLDLATDGDSLMEEIPLEIRTRVQSLGKRESDIEKVKTLIEDLCRLRAYKLSELASLLKRNENWLSRTYIGPLLTEGRLNYVIPEMKSHPDQAYVTATKK